VEQDAAGCFHGHDGHVSRLEHLIGKSTFCRAAPNFTTRLQRRFPFSVQKFLSKHEVPIASRPKKKQGSVGNVEPDQKSLLLLCSISTDADENFFAFEASKAKYSKPGFVGQKQQKKQIQAHRKSCGPAIQHHVNWVLFRELILEFLGKAVATILRPEMRSSRNEPVKLQGKPIKTARSDSTRRETISS